MTARQVIGILVGLVVVLAAAGIFLLGPGNPPVPATSKTRAHATVLPKPAASRRRAAGSGGNGEPGGLAPAAAPDAPPAVPEDRGAPHPEVVTAPPGTPAAAADEAAPAPLAGPELVAALNDVETNDMLPEASACIPHSGLPDNFSGTLKLQLNLDATGLTEATIADSGENDVAFPQPMLDCLSDVVWAMDWPGAADGETKVTYPLQVTTN